jgi:acyl-CoA thioester hydrolase
MLRIDREIPLRRRDMDGLGHLNNAACLDLMQELRGDMLATIGTGGKRFVVRRLEVDYLREVRYADRTVEVSLEVLELGSSSVVLQQEVSLPDGTVAARGRIVLVAWSGGERGRRELTGEERAALLAT